MDSIGDGGVRNGSGGGRKKRSTVSVSRLARSEMTKNQDELKKSIIVAIPVTASSGRSLPG